MKKLNAAIFSIIMFLTSTTIVSASNEVPDVVDSGNTGIDWQFNSNGTLVLEEGILETNDNQSYPWIKYANDIETIIINGEIALPETPFLFKGLTQLTTIENIEKINTSNVTDMSYMFYQTDSLQELDLSSWDTSNVTNMDNMFFESPQLNYVNLSNWDISNVVTMTNFINDGMGSEVFELTGWNESDTEKLNSEVKQDEVVSEEDHLNVSIPNNNSIATQNFEPKAVRDKIEEDSSLEGWKLVDNNWYFYKDNVKSVGWVKLNDWYYLNEDGVMASGWEKVGNKWYYLELSGRMTTGWQKINNRWFYMDETGSMLTGWIQVKNQWYYLKDDGAMVTGSHMIKNKSNVFSDSGSWLGNWEQNSKGWWFVYANNQYPTNKWDKLNNRWYYFDNKGYMVTGWKLINNKWYFMNFNGEMQTGWLLANNKWYYLDDTGAMQTNWITVNGTSYYLDLDGVWLPEGKKKIIYLDPGHGGIPRLGGNPGAVYNGVKEQDLNLKISLQVRDKLEALGYTVVMSRENDNNSYANHWEDDLYARPAHANEIGADILVSVHHNASGTWDSTMNGIETYIYGVNATYPPLPENAAFHNDPVKMRESIKLADSIHKDLISNTGAYDRKVKSGAFIAVREARMPAVLLELGFMSNRNELNKLTTASYQQKLIDGIVSGIHNYFSN